MENHRNHQNREAHAGKPRSNNTPREASPLDRKRDGSEFAPTRQATERERERHRAERGRGHFAAGVSGVRHAVEAPDVSRADLADAARQADEVAKRGGRS